jgi:hypothetical protein
MFRRTTILAALPALAALGCSNEMEPAATETPSPAPTAESVLADVVAAMGTANLESISFEGWAWSRGPGATRSGTTVARSISVRRPRSLRATRSR